MQSNKKQFSLILLEIGATILISIISVLHFFVEIFYGISSTMLIIFGWLKKQSKLAMFGLGDCIWKIQAKMWEVEIKKSK